MTENETTASEVKLTKLTPEQHGKLVSSLSGALWDGLPSELKEDLIRNQGGTYGPEVDPLSDFSRLVALTFDGVIAAAFGIVREEPETESGVLARAASGSAQVVGYEFASSFLPEAPDARYLAVNRIIEAVTLHGAPPGVLAHTHPVRTLLAAQHARNAKKTFES